MKRKANRVLIAFAAVVALCLAVFLGARYGWRLAGYSMCRTAQIENIQVGADRVEIKGSWPGIFPASFVGCRTDVSDGVLYVGFKYNKLLGVWLCDKGDFQITIPVEQPIRAVCMKAGDNEYLIWPEQTVQGKEQEGSSIKDFIFAALPLILMGAALAVAAVIAAQRKGKA